MDTITLRDGWASYVGYLKSARKSASYLKSIGYAYRSLVTFTGSDETPLTEINTLLLRRWSSTQTGVSSSTLRLRLTHLRGFMMWAYDEELIQTNQMERLKLPRAEKTPTRLLTDTEIRKLVEEIGYSIHAVRDTALVLVMLSTGTRVSEIAGLTWDNVLLETLTISDGTERKRGIITVTGKGNKQRSLPVEHMAVVALEKWGRRGRVGRVFPITTNSIAAMLSRASAAAGISHVAPHMCRVAFATAFARAHRDEWRVLQDRMGHATMGQTEYYARRSDVLLELPGPGVLETVGVQA